MGLLNRIKGEEPGLFKKLGHVFDGSGHYGEFLTDYALAHGSIPGSSKTFTNIYVPTRGRTTEIDVVQLHEKGILVFESKNYSGWIFGSAEQQQWTQSLKGGQKNRFYNPIMQNRSHIRALANHLGVPESTFLSFIVFSERCELKAVPPDTESCKILRRHHLVRDVNRALDNRTPVFNQAQLESLANAIKSMCKTEEKAIEHIETVKGIQAGQICPYCGGKLVERKGKHGVFLGCSAYPACRYTKNL